MAGFLRKKSKKDIPKSTTLSSPIPHSNAPPSPSSRSNGSPTTQRLVSGPMSLGTARKDSVSAHSTSRVNLPLAPDTTAQRKRPHGGPPPTAYTYAPGQPPVDSSFDPASGYGAYSPQYTQPPSFHHPPSQAFIPPVNQDKPLPSPVLPNSSNFVGSGYPISTPYTNSPKRTSVRGTSPSPARRFTSDVQEQHRLSSAPFVQEPSRHAGYNPNFHVQSRSSPSMQAGMPPQHLANGMIQAQQQTTASHIPPLNLPSQASYDPSSGRHSPLIDLPPEIALYQEFGESLLTTPDTALGSKPTGQMDASGLPPIPPGSSSPPMSRSIPAHRIPTPPVAHPDPPRSSTITTTTTTTTTTVYHPSSDNTGANATRGRHGLFPSAFNDPRISSYQGSQNVKTSGSPAVPNLAQSTSNERRASLASIMPPSSPRTTPSKGQGQGKPLPQAPSVSNNGLTTPPMSPPMAHRLSMPSDPASSPSMRNKPLIFAAMVSADGVHEKTPTPRLSQAPLNMHTSSYPSPPEGGGVNRKSARHLQHENPAAAAARKEGLDLGHSSKANTSRLINGDGRVYSNAAPPGSNPLYTNGKDNNMNSVLPAAPAPATPLPPRSARRAVTKVSATTPTPASSEATTDHNNAGSHMALNGNGVEKVVAKGQQASANGEVVTRDRSERAATEAKARIRPHTSKPSANMTTPKPKKENMMQLEFGLSVEDLGLPFDPFAAKAEGVEVTMTARASCPNRKDSDTAERRAKEQEREDHQQEAGAISVVSSEPAIDAKASTDLVPEEDNKSPASVTEDAERRDDLMDDNKGSTTTSVPLAPVSPEDSSQTRKKYRASMMSRLSFRKSIIDETIEETSTTAADDDQAMEEEEEITDPPPPFPLTDFVTNGELLALLLEYFSFYEWSLLAAVSKVIRITMVQNSDLREAILERYLRTVGYTRWAWDDPEPLSLSLQDLSDYMRGVSTPTHEYARIAHLYVQSLSVHPNHRDPSILDTVRELTASTRAYTRVVVRLRAQAEKEQAVYNATLRTAKSSNGVGSPSRLVQSSTSSRAPSPTYSSFSHSHSQHHLPPSPVPPSQQPQQQRKGITFKSPLFRMRRAPLLRVFVPSPDGDWLSDKSVLECEAECRRAGVLNLLRVGDVIWDIAVGDEGNVGRLIWDGSYLIDLDYTYSAIGELPRYMPTLAFPPSYFHRVIRTNLTNSNPVVHIDISPWGEEVAANLQLLQDRVKTETPQGAYHNVVRWVHRSSFMIRPPSRFASPKHTGGKIPGAPRIPIPGTDLFVDPGWYGMVVVETEGTNESLADLQDRCGPGAFPPRVRGPHAPITQAQIENLKVFRILREKSRPGEIWLRCVNVKERLL